MSRIKTRKKSRGGKKQSKEERKNTRSKVDRKHVQRGGMSVWLKQISILESRLSNQNVDVKFDDEVIKKLSELGYDQAYGARPLASVFKKFVIRPLSHVILQGEDEMTDKTYTFSIKDGEITLY